jgi:DNA-binding CsgD family transcriptional regulator
MEQGRLSAKEVEVLALIAQGHDAKSAARELTLSTHTIYERLRRAREKLGAANSREAARLFFAHDRTAEANKLGARVPVEDYTASLSPDHGGYAQFSEQPTSPISIEPTYEAASMRLDLANYLPLRRTGEQQFRANSAERMRLIGDLSSRLAMAFVSICLGALILSKLLGD